MHIEEVRNLSAALVAGLVTAALLVVLFQRFPALEFNSLYLQSQYVGLAVAVGLLPAVRLRASTAKGRLTALAVFVAGVALAVGVWVVSLRSAGFVVYAAVFVVVVAAATWGSHTGAVPDTALFKTVVVLVSVLYSFSLILVVTLLLRSWSVAYLMTIVVLTGLFLALTNELTREI
jgi:hypothetical protein